MEEETESRPGQLVMTKTAKMGYAYNDEDYVDGKVRVHICNEDTFEKTGEKLLCDPATVTLVGLFS